MRGKLDAEWKRYTSMKQRRGKVMRSLKHGLVYVLTLAFVLFGAVAMSSQTVIVQDVTKLSENPKQSATARRGNIMIVEEDTRRKEKKYKVKARGYHSITYSRLKKDPYYIHK
jgi:hypothetical protein